MPARGSRPAVLVAATGVFLALGALVAWLLAGTKPEPTQVEVADPAAITRPDPAPALPKAVPSAGLPSALRPEAGPVVDLVVDPDALPASFRAALGGLTGRLVEEDGTPVAQMPVELVGGRRSSILRSAQAYLQEGGLDLDPVLGHAVTDRDGRFRLEHIEPQSVGLVLIDPGGPRARIHPLEVTPVSGQVRDLGDIVLPGSATVAGRVVDPKGKPLANVRVRAIDVPMAELGAGLAEFRAGGGLAIPKEETELDEDLVFVPPPALVARFERRLPLPTDFTDLDGQFELTGVHPGLTTLFLDEERHVAVARGGLPTGPAGGRRDLGEFVLSEGETLAGRVVNDKGEPVAGADVMAGNPLGFAPPAILKGAGTRTDEGGRFSVGGLRPGSAYAAVRVPGSQEWISAVGQVGADGFQLTVPAPRRMTLLVSDAQQQPVEGLEVFGRRTIEKDVPDLALAPRSLRDRTTRTRDGAWQVDDLPPGPWQFVLHAPGFADERLLADLSSGDGTQSVVLEKAIAVEVLVVDGVATTPAVPVPVEHALVEIVEDPNRFDPPLASARTDAAGRVRLEGLPPESDATLYAIASHPAFATSSQPFPLPPEGPVMLALLPGARVLGSVVDIGGPPAEPLMVIMVNEDAEGDMVPFRSTLTDRDGAFVFEHVPAGNGQVQVRSRAEVEIGASFFESFFESPLAEEDIEVPAFGDLPLTLVIGDAWKDIETGELSGSLMVNGRPAPDWKVYTWGELRRVATTDSRGEFDLGRVAAGNVTLALAPAQTGFVGGMTETVQVTVAAGERRFETVSISVGAIEGRVLDAASGRPVAGARVRAVQEGADRGWGRGANGVTDAAGRYRLEPVTAGSFRVRAEADGFADVTSATVSVREGGIATGVDVALVAPIRVSGRIRIEGVTQEPRWTWLVAVSEQSGTRSSARIDAKKLTFELDDLSTGTWRFEFASDLGEMEPVTVTLSGNRADLDLVFHPLPEEPPTEEGEDLHVESAVSSEPGG